MEFLVVHVQVVHGFGQKRGEVTVVDAVSIRELIVGHDFGYGIQQLLRYESDMIVRVMNMFELE